MLLHANEVVSTDRVIDALWDADPPEDAAAALHAHVSRLRRALPCGSEVLLTRAPGYVLEVGPEQIDLTRFRRVAEAGRDQLAGGEAEAAAATLRGALGEWRGRALEDLESEPWAESAARELEELRLDVLEDRLEADLQRGEHAAVIPELRALVREQPLRERPRGQLMLALYRAGRQADALAAYTDARRALVEGLGLEPGPALQRLHTAILGHDDALQLSPRPVPAQIRRRRALFLAALVVVLAAVAGAAAFVVFRDEASPARAQGGLVVALDAAAGAVERRIPVGATPTAIAVGEGSVWLVDADARTVSRVDPATGEVSSFATGATPTDIAVGGGAVWVGHGTSLGASQFRGPVATSVARVDPGSTTSRAEVVLPRTGAASSNLVDNHVAVTRDAVWAVGPDFSVARIDIRSNRVTRTTRGIRAGAVAAGGAGVWVLGVDGALARLDERTGAIMARTRLQTTSVAGLAVGGDAVWVTSPADGTLWRVLIGSALSIGSLTVGPGVADVAADASRVWVANPLRGTVTEVAADTNSVVRTIGVGGAPRSVAARDGRVWIAVSDAGTPASTGRTSGVEALPRSVCAPVVYGGGGRADLLVVSDLPLQGGVNPSTAQMAQAVEYVLRRRGFRAGRFRVAYQTCDDSVARTGLFDSAKCAANARLYASNRDVVGVLGPLNSPCALASLPILNRARGGPLAMVSPLTSYVGLTRVGPGTPRGELASLYPTGRRSFLRVFAPDDIQAAGLAVFARETGRRRVALLHDGDPEYGQALATAFARAAGRLGVDVVLHGRWDPQAPSYRRLAEQVTEARVDAVVLSGLLDNNGAGVVRDLRARLGSRVALLATEGFTPVSLLLEQAGSAARGVYVSLNGLTVERLGPAGRDFVRAFSATQPGVAVEPSAVYAAQAAEVMLDAIARSDGSRSGVLEALFATKVRAGLLGDFGFTETGDITRSPITILRAEPSSGETIEGAVVDRVVSPRAGLVR